jgi:hypothetical protein
VRITLEIEAEILEGAPDNLVRTGSIAPFQNCLVVIADQFFDSAIIFAALRQKLPVCGKDGHR